MSQACQECGEESENLSGGLCAECQLIHGVTFRSEGLDSGSGEFVIGHSNTANSKTSQSDTPQIEDASGTQFGDYELLEEVARGGMGVIYKARHIKLNRVAALKMILSGRFSSSEERQRFHVEAEAAAKLDHPGIVPIYEIGECEERAFFAMKFIEGGSLADHLDRFREDPRAAIALLAKVTRAVHHAHQRGILHRDLKPANILLDEDDQPRITDLGLAKNTFEGSDLTNTGAILGTPSYMPPEQATGDTVITTAADIYSLGAILYELLTGSPPYRGSTAVETVMQVRDGQLEPPRKKCPTVDRDLELICIKCLEHVPDQRYGSALALANDLEAWLADGRISIRPPSIAAQASRWFQRNRRWAYLGSAVLMGILVTTPFALSVATDANFTKVYDSFPADQRPWLFSFGALPQWLGLLLALALVFVLWPSIGFLSALLGRPKSIWRALGTGCLTSILLIAVFSVLLGWMPLLQSTQSKQQVRVLTSALWPKPGQDAKFQRQQAEKLYVGLEDIPVNQRAEAVADRLSSDRIAMGPPALMWLFVIECMLMVPVVYGTAIGYLLLQRNHRVWVAWLRYTLAWLLAGVLILMCLFLVIELYVWQFISYVGPTVKCAIIVASGIGLLLVMRRWRPVSEPEQDQTIVSDAILPS